jgi:dinuclear metal center YbgI/SA1388 family protein
MTKIKEVISRLESFAPIMLQESYDNAGLIVGDTETEITSILVSLDTTEAIIDEAIQNGCNLIVSHHPIIFKGLKKINGSNYIERVIISAIKNNIAIYAMHTNLDNVNHGVNHMIAKRLGLKNMRILMPKNDVILKLAVYVPKSHAQDVRSAMFNAGAGNIGNYSSCSFNSEGTGTYLANANANPHKGEVGKIHHEAEIKIEVIIPEFLQKKIVDEMLKVHPYEEVAYDLLSLKNVQNQIGSGMIGELETSVDEYSFLSFLKEKMKTECIRHTALLNKPIRTVALCGGAGSFLLGAAKARNADIFISGDFKYHDFFDADNQLVIADIGHYESEQFTIDLIGGFLIENFSKFAVRFTEVNTNPINYF